MRLAWSARPGNPPNRGQILPCKRSRWDNPPSWGLIRDTSNSFCIIIKGNNRKTQH